MRSPLCSVESAVAVGCAKDGRALRFLSLVDAPVGVSDEAVAALPTGPPGPTVASRDHAEALRWFSDRSDRLPDGAGV